MGFFCCQDEKITTNSIKGKLSNELIARLLFIDEPETGVRGKALVQPSG